MQPLHEQRVTDGDTREQIIRLDAILQRASSTYDTDTISKLITDDFTLVTTTSRIMDRAEFLADVADRSVTWLRNETTDPAVRVYGTSCAIIVATLHSHFRTAEREVDVQIRFTDTWVNREGYWFYAAGHATRVPA
jgi:hypothetical protein